MDYSKEKGVRKQANGFLKINPFMTKAVHFGQNANKPTTF
jgi:hypothetical protein